MPEQQLIVIVLSAFGLGIIAGILLLTWVKQAFSWGLNQFARFRYIRLHTRRTRKVNPS